MKDNFSVANSGFSILHKDQYSNCCANGYCNSTGEENISIKKAGAAASSSEDNTSKVNLTPDQIEMGVETATALAAAILNREKSALRTACGRRPLIGKAKKSAYQQCVANFNAPQPLPPSSKMDSGLSTGAKWGIGIGAGLLFGLGIFAVVKLKAPKVIPA